MITPLIQNLRAVEEIVDHFQSAFLMIFETKINNKQKRTNSSVIKTDILLPSIGGQQLFYYIVK